MREDVLPNGDLGNAELLDRPGIGDEVCGRPGCSEVRWPGSDCQRYQELVGKVQFYGCARDMMLPQGSLRRLRSECASWLSNPFSLWRQRRAL